MENTGGWNHRVIKHVEKMPKSNVTLDYLAIHEVFYTDNVPTSVTLNPITIGGDDIEEIRETLKMIEKSLEQPIIDMEYFNLLSKTSEEQYIADEDKAGC